MIVGAKTRGECYEMASNHFMMKRASEGEREFLVNAVIYEFEQRIDDGIPEYYDVRESDSVKTAVQFLPFILSIFAGFFINKLLQYLIDKFMNPTVSGSIEE